VLHTHLAPWLLLAIACPAMAQQPPAVFALRSAPAGMGLIAEGQVVREEAGVGRWESGYASAGIGFARAGWKVGLSAGQFTYAYTGGGEGIAPLVSFHIGRELADFLRGNLSVELRHTMLWDAGQRIDMPEGRLNWSVRF
jgi:hypothetical protein